MRVAQVSQPGGAFEVVERPIPEPGSGEVRIRIEACGVCHSDSVTKEGHWPGLKYPRVPGHEIAGVIDAVGQGVVSLSAGQRAGVGWNGGYCGYCDNCRRGDFFACSTSTLVTGITHDGGYGEYTIARAEAVALLPDGLSAVEAAPLLCAGVTTFNALRNSGAKPGDIVAVLGLGGLGHLGVQYAAKMGFRTVGIARGQDKADLAKQLGAWRYIDSTADDPALALRALGGAKVILATVTHGPAMTAAMGGLAVNGQFLVLGAAQSIEVPPLLLITGKRAVKGWYSGTAIDSQDTVAFSQDARVRSMNEVYSFGKVNEAYERMMSGKARFRVVLDMTA
ncbi:MAG: alcohol dehydrogenase catalytic domain-containing protein [Bryobacterales bacterium]|nr:alcohol dehydrogenase catalytic domain-containing protein [Acidobacteriota bacterium]MCB9385926.1 alcohol dehydrogenase catalytic domain-containing protein [Bryobacterales bacterium]